MKHYKLVIWDLDGTIIDSYGVFKAVITEASELRGHEPPSEATIRHNFHGSLDETINAVFSELSGEDLVILMNDFLDIQTKYYERPEEHVHTDAVQLARYLHEQGARQVVVTNRDHGGRGNASPRSLVEHTSIKPYIDGIICGDEVSARKPAPEVLESLDLSGGDVLVVGDQFVDAQLAQNIGADVVLVNRSDEPLPHLERLGDFMDSVQVVESLEEIIPQQ